MAFLKGGTSGVAAEVDAATKSMRFQPRPIDVGALGAYQISVVSGTMAAGLAAASPIFSCRWGDAARTMLVRKVSLAAFHVATAFTAGAVIFDLIVARSFTASDTGGTSVLPTGNSQKLRSSFGTTLVTDLRQSATATLAAGTRTLDAQPLAQVRGFVPPTAISYVIFPANSGLMTAAPVVTAASAAVVRPAELIGPETNAAWPLVLVQNEGFIIRATLPATGTWNFVVELEWDEVLSTAGYN